jgi:PAS domain S-box-containing protein
LVDQRDRILHDAAIDYRDLAEALPAMIAVSAPDGALTYVNQRWLDYTGLDFDSLDRDRAAFIHPDDLDRVLDARRRSVEAGEMIDCDYRIRRHDGVYRWHAWRAVPVRDDRGDGRGRIVRWIGTTTDIHERKRADHALRASEERFRNLVEASTQGVWMLDAESRTTYANQRIADMLGYARDEMIGRTLFEFTDDAGVAQLRERLKERRAGQRGQYEFAFRRRDGSPVPVIVSGAPLFDDGGFAGSFAMITDVSDQRAAHEALKTSEARYRSLAELTPALISLVGTDGRIVYCNERLLGYSGLPFEKLAAGSWIDLIHPDDLESHREEWATALEQGTPIQGEVRVRRHDGAHRWHLGHVAPITRADGSIDLWIAVHIDIDDRKRHEMQQALLAAVGEALNESLDRSQTLESVVNAVVPAFADFSAVYSLEDDGSISRTAAAWSNDGAANSLAAKLTDHALNPVAKAGAPRVLRTGVPEFYEQLPDEVLRDMATSGEHLELLRATGFRSAIIVPLPSRGKILGAISFSTSHSGRRYGRDDLAVALEIARRAGLAVDNASLYEEAETTVEYLRRANAAKDEFLGLVSHELKTPITTIYGNAEVLRRKGDSLDEQTRRAAVEDVSREAERLHRIIDNLLVLARLEQGQTLEVEPTLMRRVAERLIEDHKQRSPMRVIELRAPEELIPVLCEPLYTEQVLRNLISNAEKYSPWDRKIEVVIEHSPGELCVSVLDRGSGIDPGEVERIFTPFYRSPRTSSKAGGVGIGLAVCKRLIEAQGGRVWARPREGGGSDIGFALPAIEED